jgi:hypothetical protein
MTRYFDGPREARRFTEFDYAPLPEAVRRTDNKIGDKQLARSLGIRVPETYATFSPGDRIDLGGLPDRFVLKATNMASKQGVYLLVRQKDGFLELHRKRTFTADELLAHLGSAKRVTRKTRTVLRALDAPIVAEELVTGENGADRIPYDYKLYTFDGSVEMILQVDRNGPLSRLAFFGHEFHPLDSHCIARFAPEAEAGQHRRPANWEALIDAARRMSLHINAPFVSVDLYTTGTEVVFGELTSKPGGPFFGMWRFSDEYDAELGTYYRLALRRRGILVPTVTGLPPVLRHHQDETTLGPAYAIKQTVAKLRRRFA